MITKSGFEFAIDPAALDDMELIEALAALETNPLVVPKVITLLLGKEQKERLYDHLRDENGRVRVSSVSQELAEIFQLARNDLKK